MLHDPLLLALTDPAFTCLDLWGCGNMLSDQAIRRAVSCAPKLQALDLTGCITVTPKTIKHIARSCPHLKLLRLGVTQVEQAMLTALPDILPKVIHAEMHEVNESWEDLLEERSPEFQPVSGNDATGYHVKMGTCYTHPTKIGCEEDAIRESACEEHSASRNVSEKWSDESSSPCSQYPLSAYAEAQSTQETCSFKQSEAASAMPLTCARGHVECATEAPSSSAAALSTVNEQRSSPSSLTLDATSTTSTTTRIGSKSATGSCRLNNLKWLIWPCAPKLVEQLIQSQCPKVRLNPIPAVLLQGVGRCASVKASGAVIPGRRCEIHTTHISGGYISLSGRDAIASTSTAPFEMSVLFNDESAVSSPVSGSGSTWDALDPMSALDEPIASEAAPAAWQRLDSGMSSATPFAGASRSVAERFREAYRGQARRLWEKECRVAELWRQRRLKTSSVLQALELWMDAE
ncbi:hypothetical protein CEUSTIGMA_g9151.t1 [Chlamydomonas eustigma]|uniref:Uncharacterized protein n=1 Tax=Chlamydomonas eustigma TaxID=1157962 RepID=A0A250XF93_9CHLO|nr:hypothetical protein CEUSTIGMA_g9151.t1 [Chlamydomonas eustigma]|eukprot:GAX81723.1 hypothetical protein CEUSTIGMA_g9151.t1 [Chlamydomonas eustigma]